MAGEEPLFDATRKALRFALNYHLSIPATPVSRIMADGKVQKLELADGSHIIVAASKGPPRNASLRGLDGAGTAGIILRQLTLLPHPQQLVLMGSSMTAILPCSCRAPCCSGEKANPPWRRVVWQLCEYLKEEAQLSRIKGKKGLSTSPMLREALVEKFFLPKRRLVLSELAARCGVTEQTVIAHRRPIVTFLEKQEQAGWRDLDVTLSDLGIVGTIT